MTRRLSLLLLLLLALPAMAWAQNAGKVAGTVRDAETGEPLPGATVRIEGTSLGAATGLDGEYTIFEVSPGTHTVTASFVGYATVQRSGVEVIGGITTRANFELPTSALELDVVEVTAERPLVNPTATNAVRRLGREEIAALPTRDPSSFYAIQPGVTMLNDEVYIRGGRPDETDFLLEGISSRSIMGADNVIPVIPEALEEIQVYAGGYSAEYGGANAGIVQQVLRTGGTDLSALVQYETDQVGSDAFGDPGTGYDDLTVTLGGPLVWQQHRFFVALNYQDTDNYNPMFWTGADFGTPVDDIRGDEAPSPLAWQDDVLPGISRPREQMRLNGTLSFNFHPLRIRLGGAYMDREQRINDLPVFNLYNQERLPQRDDVRWLGNAQASYFLTDNTYLEANVGLFGYDFSIYDPLFDIPTADGQGGAVLQLLDYYSRDAVSEALGRNDPALGERVHEYYRGAYTQPAEFQFNAFEFARPGRVAGPDLGYNSFSRREQGYYNLSLQLNSQQDIHELRLGGSYQRWTIRDYSFTGSGLAATLQNDPTYADSIRAELPTVAAAIRRSGHGGFGYDEFMNEVDEGIDGAKHPTTAALFINDKLEFNDIIVNAGLRWDYFDMDLLEPENPANPEFDRANWTVTGLKEAAAKSYLQPRLGLSFPVTDRTVFHLQYGKFAQMPDLAFVYEERADIATSLAGQFFIRSPFAWDLDPIKATQYEIGLGHQFTEFAAFDVTAFYRKTEGQLEIQLQETDASSLAKKYNVFANGDFSIARGFELSLRSRRMGGFMGIANYTLTDAKGTNSEPSGQVGALEQGTAPPSLIQPLMFEERHRGSFVLDYRTGADRDLLTQNWTFDVLFNFHSGRRFTRSGGSIGQRAAWEGPLLTDLDPRTRSPLEPLNASTTPWFFNTDLRLEKGFSVAGSKATAYMYVSNLFNQQQVINVYLRTGDAESDGFLTNPELSEQILAGQPPEYRSFYENINLANRQHYINDWGYDLYARPRQVRIGLRLEI